MLTIRSNKTLRAAAPLSLGVVLGLVAGAMAFANVSPAPVTPAPVAKPAAQQTLSAAPGVRFTRNKGSDGPTCFVARDGARESSETVCSD